MEKKVRANEVALQIKEKKIEANELTLQLKKKNEAVLSTRIEKSVRCLSRMNALTFLEVIPDALIRIDSNLMFSSMMLPSKVDIPTTPAQYTHILYL